MDEESGEEDSSDDEVAGDDDEWDIWLQIIIIWAKSQRHYYNKSKRFKLSLRESSFKHLPCLISSTFLSNLK